MNILLKKESMDALHKCTTENISLISTAIHMHIHNDELIRFFQEKLDPILFYLEMAYNPELIELKRQARLYYQKWFSLKDSEPRTASMVYIEYLQLKCKINAIEIPF